MQYADLILPAKSIPPIMWPLEPVAGIAKFIICSANTNPANIVAGMILSFEKSFFAFL